jgi:hypothetical protein
MRGSKPAYRLKITIPTIFGVRVRPNGFPEDAKALWLRIPNRIRENLAFFSLYEMAIIGEGAIHMPPSPLNSKGMFAHLASNSPPLAPPSDPV